MVISAGILMGFSVIMAVVAVTTFTIFDLGEAIFQFFQALVELADHRGQVFNLVLHC